MAQTRAQERSGEEGGVEHKLELREVAERKVEWRSFRLYVGNVSIGGGRHCSSLHNAVKQPYATPRALPSSLLAAPEYTKKAKCSAVRADTEQRSMVMLVGRHEGGIKQQGCTQTPTWQHVFSISLSALLHRAVDQKTTQSSELHD